MLFLSSFPSLLFFFFFLPYIHPFNQLLVSALLLWTGQCTQWYITWVTLQSLFTFLPQGFPATGSHSTWPQVQSGSAGVSTLNSQSVGFGSCWINVQSPVLQRDKSEAHSTWSLRVPRILTPVSYISNQLYNIPFIVFYPSLTFSLHCLIILLRILS